MIQNKWIRRAAFTGVLVLPILTAGCGLFSQSASKEIDPPQTEVPSGLDGQKTGQAGVKGEQAGDTQMTVYLQDENGYLAPIAIRTSFGEKEKPGQKALEMMVDGGAYASQLPEGFAAVLPQGTQIKGFDIVTDKQENKIAVVDFSSPFTQYNLQDERRIVESITWTLTAMPGIEGVEIWSEGKKLDEMPVGSYPLDEPLTRAVGINLEAAEGVDYSRSTPVTLYFSAVTANDEQYYVPVTRLINRTASASPAQAALEQLIAGPLATSDLSAVITDDVKIKSIEEKDSTVTVNLEDSSYLEGQKAPSEMLQAVVLSLTEVTGAESVQIVLNGKQNIVDSDNKDYSKPVGRPHHVNELKA
ncbi:GerMN domain-containing protein [Paenibacillus sp. GCM10023252]|uniref:GerMN domain-containing protein n=1 Tax=Paenibacillus sp. GCM10023252 TaxID=3252649 RepID=UPI003612D762